jgi:hypothetical protein
MQALVAGRFKVDLRFVKNIQGTDDISRCYVFSCLGIADAEAFTTSSSPATLSSLQDKQVAHEFCKTIQHHVALKSFFIDIVKEQHSARQGPAPACNQIGRK